MKIVHLSDTHIGAGRDRLVELNHLVAHICATHEPDDTAVAITGDLVERPLEVLYSQLRRALMPLVVAGFDLYCVPGNHDVHSARGVDLGGRGDYAGWHRHVAPLIGGLALAHGVREWRFGGHQVLGIDTNYASARDRDPDLARGCVGQAQLGELTMVLEAGAIVLGHHRVWWDDYLHRLEDADRLHDVLDPRASFYLCGHQHEAHEVLKGAVRYVAAPRSTQRHEGKLRYQVLDLNGNALRWVHVD